LERKKEELKRLAEEDSSESEDEEEKPSPAKKSKTNPALLATQLVIPKKLFGPDSMDVYTRKRSGEVEKKQLRLQVKKTKKK